MDLNKFKLTRMLNAPRGKTFVGPAPRPAPGGQSQGRLRHGNQFHNKTFKVRRNGNFIKSILKTDFRQHKSIAIVTN